VKDVESKMNGGFIKEKLQQNEVSTMPKAKTETIEPIQVNAKRGRPVKKDYGFLSDSYVKTWLSGLAPQTKANYIKNFGARALVFYCCADLRFHSD
jgi:hypothetical protein